MQSEGAVGEGRRGGEAERGRSKGVERVYASLGWHGNDQRGELWSLN